MTQTSERPGAADSGPINSHSLAGGGISTSPIRQGAPDNLLAAALDLAAHGWAVFPCRHVTISDEYKAKAPMITNGHLKASRDPNQIRTWWTRWPQAMIGAPVPDSLLVVDFDPWKNPDCVAELEAITGPLPATLTAWSGRNDGGRHLYYLRPAGPRTSTRLPKGIDLKANGYCIVPPSIHPVTGQSYRWEQWAAVPLPWKLRELIRPLPPKPRPVTRLNRTGKPLVDFVASFVTDGVNNALFWAACRAAEDGLLDQIEEELISTAVSVGESEKQAEWTVKSARKRIIR
jgi:hypothetical protein